MSAFFVTVSLAAIALVIWLTPDPIPSRALQFAFVNGTLYSSIPNGLQDRSEHTLYFLLGLSNQGDKFADMRAEVGNCDSDKLSATTQFSFWRVPSDNTRLLLPDHDFTGWATTWIAPHTAVVHALGASSIDWSARESRVYWTGAGMSLIRMQFKKCATENPSRAFADMIDWDGLRDRAFANPVNGNVYKPIEVDLRKLLKYKYKPRGR